MTPPDQSLRPIDDLQSRAVESNRRNVVVKGGPGTGKTRVVAERVHKLLQGRETPRSIVCLPLSKRGRWRIRRFLTGAFEQNRSAELVASVVLRTVGELANDFLNQVGGKLPGDTGKFYLWDDVKSTEELADFLMDHGKEPSHIGMGAFASLAALYPVQESSAAKITVERLTTGREGAFKSFHQRMRDSEALMADDLVSLAILAMREDPGAASVWASENCKHILLDDFQNIRPQQYEFLYRLLPDDGSMLIAVDPDQAVQNWRGGEPHHLDQILLQSSGAELFQFKKNYRGTRPLVEITNRLSSGEPSLSAAKPIARGYRVSKPGLIRIDGTVEEMDEYIVAQIETAVNLGQSYNEIACLSRRFSTLTRLATKCDEREIPCLLYASNRNDELYGYRLNAVSLSTIEAAQGEEWRTVWVVDVNDGIMPGPIPEPYTRRLDEERRLFKVCATRATEDLFFCYATDASAGFGLASSRFVGELEGLVEESVVRPGEPEIPANWWLCEEEDLPTRTSFDWDRETARKTRSPSRSPRSSGKNTKPKPDWDVHLPEGGNRAGNLVIVFRPLVATSSGSDASPRLAG